MKKVILFIVIFNFILICNVQSKQNKTKKNIPDFKQFKQRFKKQYATKQQQEYRKSVYNNNRKKIIQNTECVDCGVNVHSDKTDEERKNQLFGLLVPQNFTQMVAQAQHKVKAKLRDTAVSFPASFDWRDKKVITKVRNQGSCGACWAFEMTAAAESLLLIQGKGNASTLDLAEQFLLQCTPTSTCNGGFPSKAADLIVSGGGLINQSRYPYRPGTFYKSGICDAKKDYKSIATSSSNYYSLSDTEIIALLQVSPVGVTIDADSLSSRYDPTKNPVHKCSVGDNQINHGVLLVGYTPTYWIIKNSWGSKWGLDGFAYISRSRTNNQNCVIQTWITVLQVNCTVPNCNKCSTQKSNSCSICLDGFYIVPNGTLNSCKKCIDPNCQTCYTKQQNSALQGRCKICKKGFSLQISTQKCKSNINMNIPNCLVHSDDFHTCLTCDDGYVITIDGSQCMTCNVPNCDQCLIGSQDKCKTCKPGYKGDQCDMMCSEKCESGCEAPGICTKCQDGYTGKNCQIIICLDNCLRCSTPFTCEECEYGYDLPNCEASANPATQCSTMVMNCAKGCSKDSNICDECDKDFYGPHCNIQQICDGETCKTIVTHLAKATVTAEEGSEQAYKSSHQSLDSIGASTTQTQAKQTGLTIGLIVVSILFVFTVLLVGFLVYRMSTMKRINIIQPLDNQGSSKSIPYVGKNIVM